MTSQLKIADQIIWLKSIKVYNMSAKSLMSLSKLTRQVKTITGETVNLSEQNAVVKLGKIIIETNDKELSNNFSSLIENLDPNSYAYKNYEESLQRNVTTLKPQQKSNQIVNSLLKKRYS